MEGHAHGLAETSRFSSADRSEREGGAQISALGSTATGNESGILESSILADVSIGTDVGPSIVSETIILVPAALR